MGNHVDPLFGVSPLVVSVLGAGALAYLMKGREAPKHWCMPLHEEVSVVTTQGRCRARFEIAAWTPDFASSDAVMLGTIPVGDGLSASHRRGRVTEYADLMDCERPSRSDHVTSADHRALHERWTWLRARGRMAAGAVQAFVENVR